MRIYGTARVFRVLDKCGTRAIPKDLFQHRNFIQCWLVWRQFEKAGQGDVFVIQFSDGNGDWHNCQAASYREPSGRRERTELVLTQLFHTA